MIRYDMYATMYGILRVFIVITHFWVKTRKSLVLIYMLFDYVFDKCL